MKVINEREIKAGQYTSTTNPEWVNEALYWLGAFSNVMNLSNVRCRISADDEGELEEGVVEIEGWITIEPWDIEVETIARTETVRGFAVQKTMETTGSMWELPDVDIVFDCEYRNVADAVRGALLTMLGNHMDGISENIHEQRLAAELARN